MDKTIKKGDVLEVEANFLMRDCAFKFKTPRQEDQKYTEEETHRTCLRRQRDKILYCGGFRRLQGKAQVMPTYKLGDHRTRLTHTLEVEQIAVSVADALSLNKDLVSAIALGHDVGHTPFGHAGEKTLNKLLENDGGFYHPIQSVKYLWEKYEDKISKEVYEGILKHDSDMYCIEEEIKSNIVKSQLFIQKEEQEKFKQFLNSELCTAPRTLEAQVVIWADKIAYITHDFEDFKKADGLYKVGNLENELDEILHKITKKDKGDFQTRDLIRSFTTSLINQSYENIGSLNFEDIQAETQKRILKEERNMEDKKDKRMAYLKGQIINMENDVLEGYFKLRKLVDQCYICNHKIQKSDIKGKKIIESLFNDLTKYYELLPEEYQCEANPKEKKRKVAHYISTMSDDYARKLYLHLNSLDDNFEI